MKTTRLIKFHPALWLAVLLTLIVTSCATTGGNNSFSTDSNGPVKGATLLMRH